MVSLETLIRFGGIAHFGILSASALVPRVLDWRGTLRNVAPFARRLICVWAVFIVLIIIGFGTLSLFQAAALAAGSSLGRSICGLIAVFWLVRLGVQFFVFDIKPLALHPLLRVGYHGLTGVFAYFTIVYGIG